MRCAGYQACVRPRDCAPQTTGRLFGGHQTLDALFDRIAIARGCTITECIAGEAEQVAHDQQAVGQRLYGTVVVDVEAAGVVETQRVQRLVSRGGGVAMTTPTGAVARLLVLSPQQATTPFSRTPQAKGWKK